MSFETNNNVKRNPWCLMFVWCLIIVIICIGFIFAPVITVTEYEDGTVIEQRNSALGILGSSLMAESWHRYPEYTIGLGVVAGMSFAGAIFCFYMIDKGQKRDREP